MYCNYYCIMVSTITIQFLPLAAMGPVEPPVPKMKRQDLTLEQLKQYDGTGEYNRVCVGVNGKIFDVTRGKKFYGPGQCRRMEKEIMLGAWTVKINLHLSLSLSLSVFVCECTCMFVLVSLSLSQFSYFNTGHGLNTRY